MDFVFETQDSRHVRLSCFTYQAPPIDLVEQRPGAGGRLLTTGLARTPLLVRLRHAIDDRSRVRLRHLLHRDRRHLRLRHRLRVTLHVDHDPLPVQHGAERVLPKGGVQVDRVGDFLHKLHSELLHRTAHARRVRVDADTTVDAEGVNRELGGIRVQTVRFNRIQAQVDEQVRSFFVRHVLDSIGN